MNLTALKSWVSGETLTAADLNAEFQNIYTHTIDNNDMDSTASYVLGELVIGTGLAAADGGQLHVHTGSAGTVQAASDADEAVFENSTASGITILSGLTSTGKVAFGDSGDNDVGLITYNHATDAMTLTTNGTTALTLSSAQAATFAGDVSVGGALTLTGGLTLNGAVVVGDSASDTLTVNATVTSDLLFTDATYDIGKSGATRPRDGFFSRNMAVGGTLGVTGATTLSSTLGVTGALTATAGITSGSNIVSDSDSTDDLGTTSVRWANLYVDSIGDTGQALAITAGSNNINVTAGTLALTGAQTISSTLGVTGLIAASGGLSGTTGTFSGDVAVGTDKLFVDVSASRVGINSASPGAALDVAHSGTSAAFRVYNSQATDPYGILIDNTAANLSDANYVADFRVGGYSILRLNNSGQMTFAPNSYGGVSAGTLTVKTGSINSDSIRLEAGGTTSTWLESRGYLGHSWYVDSTRSMTLDSTGLGIGTSSPAISLSVTDTYNGSALTSNDIPAVQIINEQGSYTADNVLGVLGFGKSQGFTSGIRAGMVAYYSGTGSQSSNVGAYLSFRTSADAAGDSTERARIHSDGIITLSNNTNSYGTTGWYGVAADTSNGSINISRNGSNVAAFFHTSNANGINGSAVGTISITTTSTAYNTSSDYRLKENVVGITDGITRIKSLKPSRFNFIAEADRTVDGFLAHEVSDIVPEAISGDKDAVDEKGNPEYQGIDQSKLVPLLTAALQEAITKIETLETKVAALEAA